MIRSARDYQAACGYYSAPLLDIHRDDHRSLGKLPDVKPGPGMVGVAVADDRIDWPVLRVPYGEPWGSGALSRTARQRIAGCPVCAASLAGPDLRAVRQNRHRPWSLTRPFAPSETIGETVGKAP